MIRAERLQRTCVPAVDEVLGVPLKVLDDGFVRVVDYMGSDESVVQAARVSYGEGTKKVSEDRGLIRYLLRHQHTTPFEMCEIKLHVRVPMDCWRQWIRHRMSSVNEYSTRYSVAIDAMQKTSPDAWRRQSADNKQGSSGSLDPAPGKRLTEREAEVHRLCREAYEERLKAGVAREQARKDLPLSTYTEAYWKTDLHNLLRFLHLRMAPNAQQEIRSYARLIGHEIVRRWCPLTWEAFLDYRVGGLALSRLEAEIIARIARGEPKAAEGLAEQAGWAKGKKNRERAEFDEKLKTLGLKAPWT
ncbi:MAG: FAD-dependent thymidylate synthase [Elusimicrobiota bacterium]